MSHRLQHLDFFTSLFLEIWKLQNAPFLYDMVEDTYSVAFGCIALGGVAWSGVCGFATIPSIEGYEKGSAF